MKTPLEVLHKYFHCFEGGRTRDLVVRAMEHYAKICHENELNKLNIPTEELICDKCTAYPFDERGKTPLCNGSGIADGGDL